VVLVHTLRQKRDIYPLAVVGGTVILLGAGLLVRLASGVGFFTIFVVAAWLVAASTFAARRLMDYQRAWEVE
jgi:Cu/Ag efflux pump CusA